MREVQGKKYSMGKFLGAEFSLGKVKGIQIFLGKKFTGQSIQ